MPGGSHQGGSPVTRIDLKLVRQMSNAPAALSLHDTVAEGGDQKLCDCVDDFSSRQHETVQEVRNYTHLADTFHDLDVMVSVAKSFQQPHQKSACVT